MFVCDSIFVYGSWNIEHRNVWLVSTHDTRGRVRFKVSVTFRLCRIQVVIVNWGIEI